MIEPRTKSSPMSSDIIPLDQATDPTLCGHKAATLGQLIQAGFNVPPGFVIPVGSSPRLAAVEDALARLGDGPVAVRSSGVAEDLDEASFAGQYESILDVRGAEAVMAAAIRCLESAAAERVDVYAESKTARPMAVLVQRMVAAESAGVAFSADPLSGAREVVVINAVRGLSNELLDGGIDGDIWRVDAREPRAVATPHRALDSERVLQIASLARKLERARRTPQDIEWAVQGDKLYLVQSRPITALPVKPEIEVPKGTWEKDAVHFPDPVAPFAASTHLHPDVAAEMLPDVGLMIDAIDIRVIGHEVYLHIEPDEGGRKPPPWWVIGLAVRLVPSMRRKLRRADELVRSGFLEELPRRWFEEIVHEQRAKITSYAALDLSALSDDALFDHIRDLRRFAATSMRLHFELAIPHVVGTFELTAACKELLGWDVGQTSRLLQGLSAASSAPTRDLARIADAAKGRDATVAVIRGGGTRFLEQLAEVDEEVSTLVDEWLGVWGVRTYGPDCSAPNVSDRPELVAASLDALIVNGGATDLEPARQRLVEEARNALSGAGLARFNKALAYAELTYPMREDNVILTDQMVIGLARRAGIEAGRRLVAAGLVRHVDDAMMLAVEEIEHHLRDNRGARALVERRRAEMAWVRANPGPAHHGPAPSTVLPDLRGLPEAARRINGAFLFALAEELTPPPERRGDAITGIAASSGTYRGRVRVITHVKDLHRLEHGEVLVCPSTTAAWMMVFHRAGALITDFGSILTHTSIVAREHSLPAVVGTQSATAEFVDGDEVIVDGTHGTVTRV